MDGPVRRVLMLLDAFGPDGGAHGVSELARRTGLSKSTAHRLLGHLVEAEFVVRSHDKYELGSRIPELGRLVSDQRPALPDPRLYARLRQLHEATGETVRLAVCIGARAVYVGEVAGRAGSVPPRRRVDAPLHSAASGKVLLAFEGEPGVVQRVLHHTLQRFTAATITTPERLAEEIERVRVRGIAFERDEFLAGEASVAAPVLDARRTAVAALSVEGRIPSDRIRRAASAVRRFALLASQDLVETGP
ncbi:IclR family transcriptional regulator [Streptomyces sp. NPDC048629]|uniref:IclR family transcriptional regulator n=1 Tax=Streptomyces sp. NPDC048629 TaxID=3154824 RepID=UPI003428C1AB